mgnify:CR=1 FL=1|tara:strand:+ start:35697 stop:36152 length:456 start_codon:yes stop_codon:yes gene_type:complete
MRFALIILSLLGVACVAHKGVSNYNGDRSEQDSKNLQLVLEDSYSGIEQPEFQIIRDQKTLNNLFIQINKTRKPGIPIPEVNFKEEILLVYCVGTSLGVNRMEMVVAEESPYSITIVLKERTSSQKELLNATTTPIYIYRMPVTQKAINFQ